MAVFNDIRKTLIDPSQNGQARRQEMSQNAARIQDVAGLAMGGTGVVTLLSLVAMRSFPIIGGMFAFLGALATLAAHEVMVIAENTADMTKGNGPLGNIVNRGTAAWSTSSFRQRITQGTWIIGPVAGSQIEAELNRAQN